VRSRAIVAAWLLTLASATAAAPPPLAESGVVPHLQPVGSGQMRWLGLRLYAATLWSVDGAWRPQREPFALEIRYARRFSGPQLAAASAAEMLRLGYPEPVVEAWRQQMQTVFPDVRPGERLIGLSMPEFGAIFFADAGRIGEIRDPRFAEAFFAIWLDTRTRAPELRDALLGLSG
jgi:hypothetical protein